MSIFNKKTEEPQAEAVENKTSLLSSSFRQEGESHEEYMKRKAEERYLRSQKRRVELPLPEDELLAEIFYEHMAMLLQSGFKIVNTTFSTNFLIDGCAKYNFTVKVPDKINDGK